MLDIKWIRENPNALDEALKRRKASPISDDILKLDEKWRSSVQELQEMQSQRKSASKKIGAAMGQKDLDLANSLKEEVASLKDKMTVLEDLGRKLELEISDIISALPNILLDEVPLGNDEDANIVLRTVGKKPELTGELLEHYDLGENLGLMSFERAARMSGSRFTILQGQIARLERALGQFMLDLHTGEHGYQEVSPPLLVRDNALFGTGQLPKFSEDLFKTTGDHWLIPTAEVPLTNMVREEILNNDALPLRFTALTHCFRSEAGSAGRDTRGMLRQHQFSKVEMVSITDAKSSLEELERMTACAEEVLKRLGLHYRVMLLCSGDTGFGARKTHDLEVWLPGQNTYREISSCSVCGDFQARRMNARYREDGQKGTQFVHTLNGSGVAVGRALIAVLENYQNEDGSITVPDVLVSYMGGLTKIEKMDA